MRDPQRARLLGVKQYCHGTANTIAVVFAVHEPEPARANAEIKGGQAVWAGEAAQSMQKSSDKKEVILTRGGAI